MTVAKKVAMEFDISAGATTDDKSECEDCSFNIRIPTKDIYVMKVISNCFSAQIIILNPRPTQNGQSVR